MVKRFLIGTNVLIDAQAKRLPEAGLKFLKGIIDKDFTISFISYIEFLGYENATAEMEEFASLANALELNKHVIDACISLRKKHKIKLPDAIIAATALASNLILIMHNTADFRMVGGLHLVDPHRPLKQIS